MAIRTEDQRQRSSCKLLNSLVELLDPNHKMYTESLVHHTLCILSLLCEDGWFCYVLLPKRLLTYVVEVITGMVIQTRAVRNLVLVINRRWGLQTCNLAASCLLLLYSYGKRFVYHSNVLQTPK